MFETYKVLRPSDIIKLARWLREKHPETEIEEYEVDSYTKLVVDITANTGDNYSDEHAGVLIDTWAAITHGLCFVCGEFPAVKHFHQAVDYVYAGLCERCGRDETEH